MQPTSKQFKLAGYPTFKTADPDTASHHLSPFLCQHRVITRQDEHLSFRHCHSNIGNIGIHLLRYGVNLTISGTPGDDSYILLLLLKGRGELTQNGIHSTVSPQNVCVINPYRNMTLSLTADQSNLTLRVPRDLVENFIGRETGKLLSTPLHFEPSPRQCGSGLRHFMSYLCAELSKGRPSLTSSLVCRQLEHTLVGLMLTELPHNRMNLLSDTSFPTSPAYLRVAEEFMATHARKAITLHDIAQAAGISIRTLQNGFRQYRDTTPMAALRSHRLHLAREELLKANPYNHNVTMIAMDCGFTHLSKFAALFKTQFGECPSDTLKHPNRV